MINKNLEMVMVLIGTMIFLFFGLGFLTIGKNLYGNGASLLWASGVLTWFGVMGLSNFICFLRDKYKEKKK